MTTTTALQALIDAMYPDTLEAIANEIDDFENSARADSLRIIAKRQRAALSAAQDAPAASAEQVSEAVCEAVNALYFDDSSDYRGALFTVVRVLAPDMADLLEASPERAHDQANARVDALAARASQPTPAQDAAATVPDDLQDRIEAMGATRYKVVASDRSMFHRHAVVAGDGKQQLYLGREVECQNMAAKFTGAFLDGAFAYQEALRAARASQPTTASQDAAATVPCGGRENCNRFPFCGCGSDALPERDASKPAEQQGLFRKFDVRRTDGSDQPGGKHHGCEYFVLDTTHDLAAPAALAAYADAVEVTHKALADDMRARYGLKAAPTAAQPLGDDGWSRSRPSAGGRWLWREDRDREAVELALTQDGSEVAECSDEGEGAPQHYWEMTPTTQQMMPGMWKRLGASAPQSVPTAAQPVPTHVEAVIQAARNWWDERAPKDLAEAELMKAIATLDGDWPGCDDCDFRCGEPCTPATVAEQHAAIDAALAQYQADQAADNKAKNERMLKALNANRAAPTAAATVPAGWKLVPVKPIDAMVDAFENAMEGANSYVRNFPAAYAALLAATPPAPQAAPTAAHPVAGQVQAVPELRERLDMAHDASLDDDHRGCRAILMEIIRMLDAAPTAPQAPALVPLTDHHKLDNDQQVFFYEQDFYVLSNFSAFNLKFNGLTFPTSEHAYHYEKFAYERVGESVNDAFQRRNLAMSIKEAPSAHEAFKLAERWKGYRRADWDAVKVDIMREILRAKASQHEYVRRKLLETGDRELIEDSWRDDYWGWGPNRDGQNMLGKLWMEVRAGLRGITPAGTTPKEQQ